MEPVHQNWDKKVITILIQQINLRQTIWLEHVFTFSWQKIKNRSNKQENKQKMKIHQMNIYTFFIVTHVIKRMSDIRNLIVTH